MILNFQRLTFEFDDREWVTPFIYDLSPVYARIGVLQGELTEPPGPEGVVRRRMHSTMAMDIVAMYKTGEGEYHLFLIEVKDFRGHRIENKPRLEGKDLALEVALKARDTAARLAGAYFTSSSAFPKGFVDALARTKAIHVVAWVEADQPKEGWRLWAKVQQDKLERKISWLDHHPRVMNQSIGSRLPGVSVRQRLPIQDS